MEHGPRQRTALRIGIAVGVLALAGATGWLWYRASTPRSIVAFERSRLAHQVLRLRALAERDKLGSLVPQSDAVLALRESFLQRAFERSLPIREEFEDGRYAARLDSVALDLQDGLAAFTLFGHGEMRERVNNPSMQADLLLQGYIDVVDIRPDLGTLRTSLTITDFRVLEAGSRSVRGLWNPVARYFGSLRVEDWNRKRPSLEIPIRVQQESELPAVEGDFSLAACRVPIGVRVSALTSLKDRLAISLALDPDTALGERVARPSTHWDQVFHPSEARRLLRSRRLSDERADLLTRVLAMGKRDSLWLGAVGSNRDVTVIVPRPLLERMIRRLARRYLRGARVDFHPNLNAKLDKQVKASILGGKPGVGRIRGNILVSRLQGEMSIAGEPDIEMVPPSNVDLRVPVEVSSGGGVVHIDVTWDPALLTSIVCHGFRFQESVAGQLLPFRRTLVGRVRFAVTDSTMAGITTVRRDRVAIPCDIAPSSLPKVRDALVAQDKFSRCGLVMDPDEVIEQLRTLVRGGVKIRLPARIVKPFHLPVTLRTDYEAGDYRIEARAYDPEVVVRSRYLRFGFQADLRVRPKPGA